jgi:hypothetical protein
MNVSVQQIGTVVTYYFLDLVHDSAPQVPSNIARECISFNKMRADMCAKFYNDPLYSSVVKHLHDASDVSQINSVPEGSVCMVDQKTIPHAEAGVQLIIVSENTTKHVVIQRKYQQLFYNYWKLRFFTEFIQSQLRIWFLKQTWYMPRTQSVDFIMTRVLTSPFCENIHKHYMQVIGPSGLNI